MSTPESQLTTQRMTLPEFADAVGDKLGLPKVLRDAIFERESNFEHYDASGRVKRSSAGALGVGQLMPATAQRFGVNPNDPLDNIYGALKYQKFLYDRYLTDTGDEKQAMLLTAAAYNSGEGNVEKYKGIPPFEETQNYVRYVASRIKGSQPTQAIKESVDWQNPESVQAESNQVFVSPEEQAKRVAAATSAQGQSITPYDLEWHLGIPAAQAAGWFEGLPKRKQAEVYQAVSRAVTKDEAKKAAGVVLTPSADYQSSMRGHLRVGLPTGPRLPMQVPPEPSALPQVGQVSPMSDLIAQAKATQTPRDQIKSGIREQVQREWGSQGLLEGPQRMLEVVADPVGTYRRVKESVTGDELEPEVERRYQAYLRSQAPEMIAERKQVGREGAVVRAFDVPVSKFVAGLGKTAGGLTSGFGLLPNQLSDYLNTRSQVIEESTNNPIDESGNPVIQGLPEKLTSAVVGLGLTVAQLAILKRATGLGLGTIMATETALKTSDQPLSERVPQVVEAYTMGKVLDQHLSRPVSAALFGVPTGIRTGIAYKKGQISGEDAILQTLVQAGAGAILGGKPGGAEPNAVTLTKVPDFFPEEVAPGSAKTADWIHRQNEAFTNRIQAAENRGDTTEADRLRTQWSGLQDRFGKIMARVVPPEPGTEEASPELQQRVQGALENELRRTITRPTEPDTGEKQFTGLNNDQLQDLINARPKKGTTKAKRAEIADQKFAAEKELERRLAEPPLVQAEPPSTSLRPAESNVPSFKDYVENRPQGGIPFNTLFPGTPEYDMLVREYVNLYGQKGAQQDATQKGNISKSRVPEYPGTERVGAPAEAGSRDRIGKSGQIEQAQARQITELPNGQFQVVIDTPQGATRRTFNIREGAEAQLAKLPRVPEEPAISAQPAERSDPSLSTPQGVPREPAAVTPQTLQSKAAQPAEAETTAPSPATEPAPQVGELVAHPNPDIDGRQIVAKTQDGRVVVPNEGNKSGVSVVTHQPLPPIEPIQGKVNSRTRIRELRDRGYSDEQIAESLRISPATVEMLAPSLPDHPDSEIDTTAKQIIKQAESGDVTGLSSVIADLDPENRAQVASLAAEIAKENASVKATTGTINAAAGSSSEASAKVPEPDQGVKTQLRTVPAEPTLKANQPATSAGGAESVALGFGRGRVTPPIPTTEPDLRDVTREMTPGLGNKHGEIVDGLLSLALPSAKSPIHLRVAETLGARIGEMHHRAEAASAALGKWVTKFYKAGVDRGDVEPKDNPGVQFASALSAGGKVDPKFEAAAQLVKTLFDGRLRLLEEAGVPLNQVRENYFPGMWTRESRIAFNAAIEDGIKEGIITESGNLNTSTPEQRQWVRERVDAYMKQGTGSDRDMLGYIARRPLAGKESFKKEKVFDDILTAQEFGLRPFSNNPMEIVKLKLAEIDRSIMAHQFFNDLKAKGQINQITPYEQVPAGWTKINDKYGTIYGPPTIELSEHVDKAVYQGLLDVATKLGISHERVASLRGGNLGLSYQGEGRIQTRFATETSVMAHEIGHQLDEKYNLWDNLLRTQPKSGAPGKGFRAGRSELRDIADLTERGKSARSKEEKIAQVLEAYIHSPERMEEVAPRVFKWFDNFVKTTPELAPLADIKPGIALQKLTTEKYIGLPILGYRIVPQPVGDILNNYLSSSLYNSQYFGKLFKGWMATASVLNQSQLGIGSAFHASFTSGDVQTAAGANMIKDIYGAVRGNRDVGDIANSFGKWTTAIVRTPIVGDRVLNAWRDPNGVIDPKIAQVVRATELAQGGFKLERGLKTEQLDKMIGDWYSGHRIKAAFRSPIAATELMAKPILEWLVPREKAGAFADMAWRIIEQNPGNGMEELTPDFRKAWNRIDGRLGEVRYDRIFINNAAKNVVQGLIRAPGWTGGTLAELGGAFKDVGSFVSEWAKTGKAPQEMPDRVAYGLSLLISTAVVNGMLTYAFTGEKPHGLDFWAFRDGGQDKDGNKTRLLIPTYMKDILAYYEEGPKALVSKGHPLISLVNDVAIKNQDYFGQEIRNPEDSYPQQAGEVSKYVLKAFIPFWIRGVQRQEEQGAGLGRQAASYFGVMPAPGYLIQDEPTKALNTMIKNKLPAVRTPPTDRQEAMKEIIAGRRSGEDTAADLLTARQEGLVNKGDVQRIAQQGRITPMQAKMESVYRDYGLPGILDWYEKYSDYLDAEDKVDAQRVIRKARLALAQHPENMRGTTQERQTLIQRLNNALGLKSVPSPPSAPSQNSTISTPP